MIIVQIGANKGNTDNDPIWKLCQENAPDSYNWHLILVEPNPKAIPIIRRNYEGEGFLNVDVVNIGVSDKEEELTLYVDNDIPGNEASQHSSLYKSHMHKMGHSESALTEYKVKCVPLSYILPLEVDYLQIDTEGYDDKILLATDFNYHKVNKIEYEHVHIGAERNTLVKQHLESFGYTIKSVTFEDTIYEMS
jgi:FkbM family methyltransferase